MKPTKPFYLFTPLSDELLPEYEKGWQINNIFLINSTGIKTHRDHFAIDFDDNVLRNRISKFRDLREDDNHIKELFRLADTRDWNLSVKRKSLAALEDWNKYINVVLYRPFDLRAVYFHPTVVELPRTDVMKNLIEPNLALLAMRRIRTSDYSHFFVSNTIIGKDAVSVEDACYVFPLYSYENPEDNPIPLFSQNKIIKTQNISSLFINEFRSKIEMDFISLGEGDMKTTFGPEDIFHYIYAIFHSPTYRKRYAEFLKIDFPRVPLTSDKKLFAALVKKGKELVSLHLLKSAKVQDFVTTYLVSGDNQVVKVVYEGGKVWINPKQYFGGVLEEVWKFKIGGYQVCDKWLKDRKGRALNAEDISHYQRVVVALKETIRLMKEIDEVIPKWPIE